jgi:hypothetical protein
VLQAVLQCKTAITFYLTSDAHADVVHLHDDPQQVHANAMYHQEPLCHLPLYVFRVGQDADMFLGDATMASALFQRLQLRLFDRIDDTIYLHPN